MALLTSRSMTNRVEIVQNYEGISTKSNLWFRIVIALHNSFILVVESVTCDCSLEAQIMGQAA